VANLFQVRSFINYWLDAVDDHSLHSPFFFDLYRNVVVSGKSSESFKEIESVRHQLLTDESPVEGIDLGGGSALLNKNRTIKDIARTSLSTPSFLQMYHRIVEYFHARYVVELGTSLGISSLYLAKTKGVELITFEGTPSIAERARRNFALSNYNNIKLIEGDIDSTLPHHLGLCTKIDVAFMDANHRYEPTIRYFNWLLKKTHDRSVIIVDDIHYSSEMERAWNEMKTHRLVYGSADLYRCGLLFFDPSVNRQHVVLQK
jgi:predicted O-methyltransferase YrrM